MGPRILFSAPEGQWPLWRPHLLAAFADAGLDVTLTDDPSGAWTFDYVVYAPGGPVDDFAPFERIKAVLSLWAGVETIVGDSSIVVPLCRMVDVGLTRGMVEWVVAHTMRYHIGTDTHVLGQDGLWRNTIVPPLAADRTVGILGLGELGRAAATALAGLGFRVTGWSRGPRELAGVETRSGAEGLDEIMAEAEILVLMLPATAATEGLLDARALARLPRGARIINPGRGTLIDDTALLKALDHGHVAHATLDVFRDEPLPADHPFWAHPRITVTPHIAAATRPETAAFAVAENVRRGEAGEDFLHVVNRAEGY